MGKVIGIDLGTTNSCVAVLENDQRCDHKRGRLADHTIGCGIYQNGERLVGDAARRQAAVNCRPDIFLH